MAAAAHAASSTAPGRNGSIAFRRFFDDQHNWGAIFITSSTGTRTQQITHPARGIVDNSPDWAADGSAITFTRCAAVGLCHVWTVKPDGSGVAPVGPLCAEGANETTCPDDAHASFAPDSRELTFIQSTGRVKAAPVTGDQIEHSAIALMNRDGGSRHVVYTTSGFAADLDNPMLSPDGKQIVFERHNSGFSKPVDKHAVFVIGSDGSNLRRLTPWAENGGDNPDWSPDGKWILFHTHVDDGHEGQYFLVHPDGTGHAQLSHFARGNFIGSASFSPDGRSITFSTGAEGGNIDVYTMQLDGSHVHRLTRSKLWDSAPDWGPVSVSPDRMVATAAASFPSGTWRVTVTTHDLVSRGVTGSDVFGNRGVWTFTFTGTRWTENQRETVSGPVTDSHHGRIAVQGDRVCFTDTGEHFSIGCYTWARSGDALRFTKMKITGEMARTDGPAILEALFIAHPWRRV